MNLEEFKVLSKEQIIEYGDKIPLGYEYDNNDNILTYKNSISWSEYTYDENNNELTHKNSNGLWDENTYNDYNNVLSYKSSNGYWSEYTYDNNYNLLTNKNSTGYWYEYTYNDNNDELSYKNSNGLWDEYTYDDNNNNRLTHKNSDGIDCIFIIKGKNYTLWYDINTKNYIAGCQNLSYTQCIKFFDKNKYEYKDAELFMKAIEEHHKTVV